MQLAALAAIFSLVDGICFTAVTESVPRSVLAEYQSTTNGSCQLECMKLSNTLSPEYLNIGKYTVCPDTPLDGEASPRVYVLSVIFPNGTYGIFDNIAEAVITWNGTTKNYDYVTQFGYTATYQPIYAAMCAYYKPGGKQPHLIVVHYFSLRNDCDCTPLPFEESTAGIARAYRPTSNPTGACATGYAGRSIKARNGQVDNCDPCSGSTISCIYNMWIIAMFNGTKTNSFAISNGTCYPKQ
ncbi:hypothetical protein PRIPAC_81081 [Pristionchus pacificus]|uniref:Uncharacterized protein n=1 Tax=Pristionchus pacificus TaxID=54126 RepID=A0A2A6CPP9_PRIPA|nr:hypothetical protein PRIPAC_81081 [Pristionchus pacificus]|eukprot:PDM80185.1 hypothetical protein PRIPAC_32764 [Pristionchus pacificus]